MQRACTFSRRDRPRIADLPKAADVVDTLITPAGERHVTMLETAAAPGGSGSEAPYTLPSECEVCYVVQGTIEVWILAPALPDPQKPVR